ncbi:MAG: anaerobic ribonucleoside-triphosphate reductase, partial [Desulfobacterales bacterium]
RCSAKTEVYSRVVGYLRPVKQWNDGKRAEFEDRKTFCVDEGQAADTAAPEHHTDEPQAGQGG